MSKPVGGTPGKLSYAIEEYTPPSVNSTHDLRQTFSWNGLLSEPGFVAAPVSAFKHVRIVKAFLFFRKNELSLGS